MILWQNLICSYQYLRMACYPFGKLRAGSGCWKATSLAVSITSRAWLMANIPIEKRILRQWLRAGYVEKGIVFPTRDGTPQSGIISPTLANMTLDGLEAAVHATVPRRSRVNFVRYADDFIITGKSKTILGKNVIPVVRRFLTERGLQLSEEKTKITFIRHGFTFLGQTFRKHGQTLHITPAKQGSPCPDSNSGNVHPQMRLAILLKGTAGLLLSGQPFEMLASRHASGESVRYGSEGEIGA